ncbi:MAG TPA: hypothetical protein VFQ40_07430 [Actinomycetota bacterium]|nr:hypothetical protein [Actinomycetota bacterium]
MPGPDLAYRPEGPDLYPPDQAAHAALVAWCSDAFRAAEAAKRARETKWRKYHRIYRSYVEANQVASWRSAMFVPYTFSSIEAMVPKLVSSAPKFVCEPIGPEDVIPAKLMEQKLLAAAEQTHLRVELIKGVKTCLKYGTGIIKNFWKIDVKHRWVEQPKIQMMDVFQDMPVTDPTTGAQVTDVDGFPEVSEELVGTEPEVVTDPETGEPVMEWVKEEFTTYAGPASCWVDPFHFWLAPEATSIDDARYSIERFYREQHYIAQKILEGTYQLPPWVEKIEETFPTDETVDVREREIGGGGTEDVTRKPVELLEFHTSDNRVITMMNRTTIIRVQENPYWHGEKPYSMWPDYLDEGSAWGIGEVEAIEGVQDMINAIYNQRIDNVRLGMDKVLLANVKALEDENDLIWKPGGVVRVVGDYLPQEAVQVLELGDVTASSFQEAEKGEQLIERITGIGGYQLGQVEEGQNRTATGVSLITEQGSSKFQMKVQLMEELALVRTARQWGSMIQQYTTEEELVRQMGPAGTFLFGTLTPDAVQGNIDYRIDVLSSTQNETVKKEQALMLAETLSAMIPQAVPKLAQDLLEAFGVKDFTPYLLGTPDLMMLGQIYAAQAAGGTILPFMPNQQQQPGQPGQPPNQQQQQGGGGGGYGQEQSA